MEKLVSIIMPAYNCVDYIAESIRSVQNQTYQNWELIVADDNSTDGTVNTVRSMAADDNRIHLLETDIWLPDKLSRQISFMEQTGYDFTYTAYEKINERSEYMGIVVSAPKSVNYSSMLYRGDPIGNLTVVYDATKLGKFYVPDIKKRNDFALWLKMMHDCKRAYGLNEVLASYRVRAGAISSTRKSELMKYYWKLYRDIENLSNIKASVAMISLVFFKSMRRVNQKIQESINKFRTKQVPGNQTDVKNSSKSIAKIVNGSEDIIFRNTEENAISATVDDVMMSNVIKNKKEGL